MKIKIKAPLGISEKGQYPVQCNSFFPHLANVKASDQVFVLCDGISGHTHSEVASAVVAQALGKWMSDNVDLSQQLTGVTVRRAVVDAQDKLDNTYSRYEVSRYPMGTTMAMIAIGNFGVAAAHIGNTRVYHIRPSQREILYRSRDHSLVNDLFVAGRLTRAEAEASKKKNVLTRAMLPSPCDAAVPDVAFITDIKAGDYFVLCCDGMTGALSDKKLKDVLCNSKLSNAQKLASLKMLTNTVPANHSILLIEVERVENEDGDHLLVNTERLMCDKMVRRSVILAPKAATAMPPHESVDTPPTAPVPNPDGDDIEVGEQANTEITSQELMATTTHDSEEQSAVASPLPPTRSIPATDKKKSLKRILWIILAALLLIGAITAMIIYNNKKDSDKVVSDASKSEEKGNPDVTISKELPNNVVPEEGLEPFDNDNVSGPSTGSNVAVTPAKKVDIPMPDKNRYDTGSNVSVPRVKEGDPYPDAFDNKNDYKELEKEIPETPVANNDEPKQQPQPGGVPPRKKANNDPTSSNRNVAVPPPPSKKQNFQVP
ncbi:MAG: serine/threonine-protein phosphatase [Muribaculaceae bacterium]|nr:serine/threonine-protein phosphatase [Muribaculaceae bacterium]